MSFQGPPPPYPGGGDTHYAAYQDGAQQPPAYPAAYPAAYGAPQQPAYGQPVAYAPQPVAYAQQPVAYAVPITAGTGLLIQGGGGGGGGGGGYDGGGAATAVALPVGGGVVPEYDSGSQSKYRDIMFGLLFWAHVVAIVGVGFALGPAAIRADAARASGDPTASPLRINAYVIAEVVAVSCAVSGFVAALGFHLLKRAGGAMIRIALWVNFLVLAAMAAALCVVALPAGIIMAIPAVLTLVYIRCVERRIRFAAAHLQAACDALQGTPVFAAAVGMLLVQTLWNATWSLAAVGVNARLSGNATASLANTTLTFPNPGDGGGGGARALLLTATSPTAGSVSAGEQSGAIAVFLMLLSFYWGSQVFANVMTFVSATVVRGWWFGPERGHAGASSVWLGLRRALTTSFGSIAFGSLIVAVLRALEATARAAERSAKKDGKAGAAFAAACLLCLLGCARKLAEYFKCVRGVRGRCAAWWCVLLRPLPRSVPHSTLGARLCTTWSLPCVCMPSSSGVSACQLT